MFPFLRGFGLGASLIIAIGAQNAFVLRQGLRREQAVLAAAICAGCDALLIALGAARLAPLFRRPAAWRILDCGVGVVMWAIALTLARSSLNGVHWH